MNNDEFEEALANVAKLADSNKGIRVEPSADDRAMAKQIRQAYAAYRDEGFSRAEALGLASIPMREMVQYALRKSEEEGQ